MGSKRKLGQARRQWEQITAPAQQAVLAVEAFTTGVKYFPQLFTSPAAQAALRVAELWETSHKTIYSVDVDLQKEIVRTGMPTGDIPGAVFTRLPHQAPLFILPEAIPVHEPETGATLLYDMFIVTATKDPVIDHATGKFLPRPQPLLRFVWFGSSTVNPDEFVFTTSSLHLSGSVNLHRSLDTILTEVPPQAGEAAEISKRIRGSNWVELNSKLFPVASMLVVYACSQEPDFQELRPPQVLAGGSAARTSRWDLHRLGFRVGAAIRAAQKQTAPSSGSPASRTVAPHVRKAHWHRFWTGPRNQPDQRALVLRWIPPVPVNIGKEKPAPTVHPLRERSNRAPR